MTDSLLQLYYSPLLSDAFITGIYWYLYLLALQLLLHSSYFPTMLHVQLISVLWILVCMWDMFVCVCAHSFLYVNAVVCMYGGQQITLDIGPLFHLGWNKIIFLLSTAKIRQLCHELLASIYYNSFLSNSRITEIAYMHYCSRIYMILAIQTQVLIFAGQLFHLVIHLQIMF